MSIDGVIGIPCRVQGRWSPFWQCLSRLERPANVWIEPQYDNSVARSRNNIVKKALELDAKWIFWLDDDLMFGPDVLMQLLERPEDIVIGLTMMRMKIGGQFKPIWSNTPMKIHDGDATWTPVDTVETGPNGLMPLLSGTGGGVLMKMPIFDKFPAPWWTMGQHVPDMFWEDIGFYEKITAAGVQIWGDPRPRFGHIADMVIWPHQQPDGTWITVIADGFNGWMTMPWQVPVMA